MKKDEKEYNWCPEERLRILVLKPKAKRPLERHKYASEDCINIYLIEKGSEGVDWIRLA
jgi:hypothetical protein